MERATILSQFSFRCLKVTLCALFALAWHHAGATAWTTSAAGPVTNLSNWTDGSVSPSSFATPGDTWTIAHSMTIASPALWEVGTTAAAAVTVTLGTGGTIAMSGAGGTTTITIHGNFVMSGGTHTVGGAGTTQNVTVNGNVTVSAGTISSTGSSTLLNLTVNGAYNMSGGTATTTGASSKIYLNNHGAFAMTGGSFVSASSSSVVLLNLYGNCSYSGPCGMTATGAGSNSNVHLMLPSGSGTMLINNTSTGTWSKTNIYIDAGCIARLNGNFSTTTGTATYGLTVNGGLYCPSPYTINGTGIFNLTGTGFLSTGHAGGVNAAITTSGTVTLNSAAAYEFSGTVAQTTGTMLPVSLVSPSQLIINNAAGVSLTTSVVTTGSLVFFSGILHTGGNAITTPGTGGVTGAGINNYVDGRLIKTITGLSSVYYEVGDISFAPMNLTLTPAGTSGTLSVQSFSGLHPSVATSGISSTAIVNHYWRIGNSSVTGATTFTPKGTYNGPDILGGSNATFLTQRYEGSAWLGTSLPSINITSVPYSTTPTSGIALPVTTADIIYGDFPCGTLPITGTPTVCVGATTALTSGTPGGTWNSSTPAVATVSSSGLVTGLTAGTSIISYTESGCTVTQVVTVVGLPDAGTITGVTIACIGFTTTLNSTVPGGTWSSGTPAVGTISTSGVVTGLTAGTTIITYSVTNSCGTGTATVAVTVSSTLTVAPITGGDSVCVGTTITLSSATGGGVWSSFNTSLATVSTAGIVTGVGIGIDTIYYTITNSCGTAKAKKVVKVKAAGTCPTTGLPMTVEDPHGLHVFPNPSAGNITLSIPGINEDAHITVTDIAGRVVTQFIMSPGRQKEIELHQPAGLYIISATTSTERHIVKVRIE